MFSIFTSIIYIFISHRTMHSIVKAARTFVDGARVKSSIVINLLLISVHTTSMVLADIFTYAVIFKYKNVISLILIIINLLTTVDGNYFEAFSYFMWGLSGYNIVNYTLTMLKINTIDSNNIDMNLVVNKSSNYIKSNIMYPFGSIINFLVVKLFALHNFLSKMQLSSSNFFRKYFNIVKIWQWVICAIRIVYTIAIPYLIFFLATHNPALMSAATVNIAAHVFCYVYYNLEYFHRKYINPNLALLVETFGSFMDDIHYAACTLNTIPLYYLSIYILSVYTFICGIYRYAMIQSNVNLASRLCYVCATLIMYTLAFPAWFILEKIIWIGENITIALVSMINIFIRCYYFLNIDRLISGNNCSSRIHIKNNDKQFTPWLSDKSKLIRCSLMDSIKISRQYYNVKLSQDPNKTLSQDSKATLIKLGKNIKDYHNQYLVTFKHGNDAPQSTLSEKYIPQLMKTILTYMQNIESVDFKKYLSNLIWEECIKEDSMQYGKPILEGCKVQKLSTDNQSLIRMMENTIDSYRNCFEDKPGVQIASNIFCSLISFLSDSDVQDILSSYDEFKIAITISYESKQTLKVLEKAKRMLMLSKQKTLKYKEITEFKDMVNTVMTDDKDLLNQVVNYFDTNSSDKFILDNYINSINKIIASLNTDDNTTLSALESLCIKAGACVSIRNWDNLIQKIAEINKTHPNDAIEMSGADASKVPIIKSYLLLFWNHMHSYILQSFSSCTDDSVNSIAKLLSMLENLTEEESRVLETFLTMKKGYILPLIDVLAGENQRNEFMTMVKKNSYDDLPFFILQYARFKENEFLNTMCSNFLLVCMRSLQSCSSGLLDGLKTENHSFNSISDNIDRSESALQKEFSSVVDSFYLETLSPIRNIMLKSFGIILDESQGVHANKAVDMMIHFPVGLADSTAFFEANLLGLFDSMLNQLTHSMLCFATVKQVNTSKLVDLWLNMLENIEQQKFLSFMPNKSDLQKELMSLLGIADPSNLPYFDKQNKSLWEGIAVLFLMKYGYIELNDKCKLDVAMRKEYIVTFPSFSFSSIIDVAVYVLDRIKDILALFICPLFDMVKYVFEKIINSICKIMSFLFNTIAKIVKPIGYLLPSSAVSLRHNLTSNPKQGQAAVVMSEIHLPGCSSLEPSPLTSSFARK